MLLVGLLSCFSGCLNTADLVPPFRPNYQGNIGYWAPGGCAQINEDYVMLVPPIQYRKGQIWTNVEVPEGDWAVDYTFQIPEGDNGGGFALWFIDKYGAEGDLLGGPCEFQGVCLHCIITSGHHGQHDLELRVVQNLGLSKTCFRKYLPVATAVCPYDPQRPFMLTVGFYNRQIVLNFDRSEIARVDLEANLTQNYIGITALTERRVSLVKLLKVEFQMTVLRETLAKRNAFAWQHKAASQYQPPEQLLLRKPSFNVTLAEYTAFKSGSPNEEGSVDRLFAIIDEVNAASFEVASFAELNSFVNDKLVVYGQKWHRRTMKIVERVQQSRNVAEVAWKHSESMLQVFNASLKQSLRKSSAEFANAQRLFKNLEDTGIDADDSLGDMVAGVNQAPQIRIFLWLAEIELTVFVTFLIVTNIPFVKNRILGLS
jgi:hypothetical protein